MSAQGRPFELPNRREQETVSWRETIGGVEQELSISFGYARDGRLREIFCSGYKSGAQMRALATDASILISHLLQRGAGIFEIAAALGEDREEHKKAGPPASMLGAIARKACELIAERPYICPKTEEICTRMRGLGSCECESRGVAK